MDSHLSPVAEAFVDELDQPVVLLGAPLPFHQSWLKHLSAVIVLYGFSEKNSKGKKISITTASVNYCGCRGTS